MEPNRIIFPVLWMNTNPRSSVGVSSANGQGLNEARPKSPAEGGIKPFSASVQTGRAAMSMREEEVVFSGTVPIPATGRPASAGSPFAINARGAGSFSQ